MSVSSFLLHRPGQERLAVGLVFAEAAELGWRRGAGGAEEGVGVVGTDLCKLMTTW